MIDPNASALRRRADELLASAKREMPNDEDTAALLLFYAAECGLKSLYMINNNLKTTRDVRGGVSPAREFNHNLIKICTALRIPRSSLEPIPELMISRTREPTDVSGLHQAWRYGEKIENTDRVCEWLARMIEWVKRNR
jgi:hypothetical protein